MGAIVGSSIATVYRTVVPRAQDEALVPGSTGMSLRFEHLSPSGRNGRGAVSVGRRARL